MSWWQCWVDPEPCHTPRFFITNQRLTLNKPYPAVMSQRHDPALSSALLLFRRPWELAFPTSRHQCEGPGAGRARGQVLVVAAGGSPAVWLG